MLNLKISGMTCGHCVSAITKGVQMVSGAENVAVDLARGEVKVGGYPDAGAVRAAIIGEGYEVVAG